MWKEVASGEGWASLSTLKDYEGQIAEGQKTALMLRVKSPVPQSVLDTLNGTLEAKGVDAELTTTDDTLGIITRKGLPWLAIIAGIILGIIALAILIVSWMLWKEVAEVLPQSVMIGGAVVGIILIAVIAYVLAGRRG